MRIGECLGLRWEDLDFDNRIIDINHSLVYRNVDNSGNNFHISTPKTEAGCRKIPMITEVYDAFMEEYQIQQITGFCTQEIEGYSGFVFANSGGTITTAGEVNRAIHSIVADYNKEETANAKIEKREPLLLPDFSAHHLRHTFCTRLCENETNLKVIQSVMGHKDIQTTMDIYADCTEEKKKEVIKKMENKIFIM
jgi:integrase